MVTFSSKMIESDILHIESLKREVSRFLGREEGDIVI